MQLPEICVKRPVFATVLSLIVLLIGLISYTRLSVREYPRIDEPVVSVSVTYRGASAEVVESQVTKPLEDSLAGIEGVEVMTSQSRSETSRINVRFTLKRDPDSAAADVRDKVARARGKLPDTIDEPIIAKVEADSQPIIYIAVQAGSLTPLEASDYVKRYVQPRLSVLPGAADVRIFGERQVSMRINLDRTRLAAYKLTVQDVEDAIRRQNAEIPAGRIESTTREFTVVAETDVRLPEQFNNIIVANVGGYPVRIRDVGRAEIGAVDERVISRYNGNSSLNIGVIKQAVANPLDLSRAVRAEVAKMNEGMPPGMKLVIAYDTSVFIDRSINSVFETIAEAILLVVLVIYFFLRSLRATIIPIVTIPVSLVGAFGLMYLFGFTINTLTLLAIVLAIGLVVDDAIVMLENIFRHVEEGLPRKQAAIEGAREIGFAIVAMTLTLASVFAPLAFAQGRTGRLFIEFALTLAGAVLVSGFVALTLSPMMCSVLLKHQERHSWVYNLIESFLTAMTNGYRRTLKATLANRWLIVVIWFLVAAAGAGFFSLLKAELAPTEDRGVVFGLVTAPQGSTPQFTADQIRPIEEFYSQIPEAAAYTAISGFPTVVDGNAVLRLKPWEERKKRQQTITDELRPKMASIPGAIAFPINPPSLGQSFRSTPVEFVVMSQVPYPELQRLVDRFVEEARKYPGVQNLQIDLRLNTPEVRVNINRDKLSDIGVAVDTVGRTLETMLGGRQVTRFKKDGEQYDVIVQVAPLDRTTPADISDAYVRARDGGMVQLSNLVDVREGVAPQSLNHFNRLRAVKVTATLAPGYAIGEALKAMNEAAARALPNTAQTDLDGQSREFRSSGGEIYLTFVLALAFIYLVLSAQFESFINPFVIMLSVPLSMTGALLTLWLAGGTLNIYSQVGLVTLVGLITKHGILIVEFSNQLRAKGEKLFDAVVEAATLRLRPILMTTGAMVLGALPLALATGAGAESRTQIGWVIVGGMTFGTLLTLFVVPTAYTLLAGHAHVEAHGMKALPSHELPSPSRVTPIDVIESPRCRCKQLENLQEEPMSDRLSTLRRLALAAALTGFAASAQAVTEIQWWHAMTGANNDRVNNLAKRFNESQSDYKVNAVYKGSYPEAMAAAIAAFRAGNAPHILQVVEVGTATMMAAKTAVKPVHEVMTEAGEKFDPKAYVPAVASYYTDYKGQMLSFPFNSSTTVFWYNKDAFEKAGLDPNRAPQTWPEVVAAMAKLKASGHACPFTTGWQTWTQLESFSAWHNVAFLTKDNGFSSPDAQLVFNGPVQVRHIENMQDWIKKGYFVYGGRKNEPEAKFYSGECAMMTTSSAAYGTIKQNAKFKFAESTLPYYADVTGAPQNTIIGGASLWVMSGKKKDEYKGVAKFLTFLSQPDVQAAFSQETGYLPVTMAAYELTKKSGFYEKNPGTDVAVQQMIVKTTKNSRGVRAGNMPQIRDAMDEELEAVWAGKKTAKQGLDDAVKRGNEIIARFNKANKG